MGIDWLFTPWNAIYSLPLITVLVLVLITSLFSAAGDVAGELGDLAGDLGLDHGGDGPAALEAGHEGGADLDADGGDLPVHADHAGPGDATGAHHTHAGGPFGAAASLLAPISGGGAPITIVLQSLVLCSTLTGLSLHRALGVGSVAALVWSLPVSLLVGGACTRAISGVFRRVLRAQRSSAVASGGLVGRRGRVVFRVDAHSGTIHLRDQHGTLHRLRARAGQGVIEAGSEVVVDRYDPDGKRYEVSPLEM